MKASVSILASQVVTLNTQIDAYGVKYRKVRNLLNQALSHRDRFERAVKAIATRQGTCWCGVKTFTLIRGKECVLHTVTCDQLYLAVYGGERGE